MNASNMLNYNLLLLTGFILLLVSCQSGSGTDYGNIELKSQTDSIAYAAGASFTGNFEKQGIDINEKMMARGLSERLSGITFMSDPVIDYFMKRYQAAAVPLQGKPFSDENPVPVNLDTLSYAFGAELGRQLDLYDVLVSDRAFLAGATERTETGARRMTKEEIDNQLRSLTNLMKEQQVKKNDEILTGNIQRGKLYMEDKAKEPGVRATESGLHYKVLKEGAGRHPSLTDSVTIHYEARQITGKVFDSSYERGEPASFPLEKVLPAWKEGIQLMRPGAKYRLYVPSDLAYGEKGYGEKVEPGEMLIYDIELLEVK